MRQMCIRDRGTCAIALGYVSRMNIEHNYIHDVSYSAISMGWGWDRDLVVMHDNRIHANLIMPRCHFLCVKHP